MTDETPDGAVRAEASLATPAPAPRASRPAEVDDEDLDVPPPSRAPRANPFGSVWDSQLGTPIGIERRVASAARRRGGLRGAGDPGVPHRRAATQRQPRWSRRRARCPRRAIGLPVGDGARALRARRRWWRHQPLSRRERPDPAGAAAARGPRAGTERPARASAPVRPWLERAVERRPARARGHAPGPGRAEAGSRPTWPGTGPDVRTGRRPGWRGGRGATRRSHPDRPRRRLAPRASRPPRRPTTAKAAAKPRATRKPAAATAEAEAASRRSGDGRRAGQARHEAEGDPQACGQGGRDDRRRQLRRCRAGRGAEAPDDAQGGGPGRTRLSTAMDRARTRGQAVALRAIAGMIRGPAPHAVLLVGPDGVGKTTLALDLAAGLLCTAAPADRPCRAVPGLPAGRARQSRRPPSARSGRSRTPGRDRRTRCQVPRRPRSHRRAGAHAGRRRPSGRHHRGRRADERGCPVGPPQDARGAAGGRDHHPVRRRRGAPPADRPVALLPGPARAGRAARHRGDPRATTAWPIRRRLPGWAGWPAGGPVSRWPTPGRPRRCSSGPSSTRRPARPDRCPPVGPAGGRSGGRAASAGPRRPPSHRPIPAASAAAADPATRGTDPGAERSDAPERAEDDPAGTTDEPIAARSVPASDRRRAVEVLLGLWTDVARDLVLVGSGGSRSVHDTVLLEELSAIARSLEPGHADGVPGALGARRRAGWRATSRPSSSSIRSCSPGRARRAAA